MRVSRTVLRTLVTVAATGLVLATGQAARAAGFAEAQASAEARMVVERIAAQADNGGRPFAVVDKKDARLFVFDAEGRLAGATKVLLGQAIGDETVPGVGDKPPSQVLPHERTTPAGRFAAEPGINLSGEAVVWVDYDAGFAIHRLRPGASQRSRLQRLASPSPADKRASLGCVVVPGAFFDGVVRPTLGHGRSVVYVLPETRPVATLFGDVRLARQ